MAKEEKPCVMWSMLDGKKIYKKCPQVYALQQQRDELLYDLAIIYEHTNLEQSDANPKENFMRAIAEIRARTEKYENLKLTAGPIHGECPPEIAKRIEQAISKEQ